MNKFFDWIKQHKLIAFCILLFLVSLVVVPMIIWQAYLVGRNNAIITTDFSAGDILVFVGAILGGSITLIGVLISIKYARSNFLDDIKNRVQPFLAASLLQVESTYNPIMDCMNQRYYGQGSEGKEDCIEIPKCYEYKYEEYEPKRMYIVIRKNLEPKYLRNLEEKEKKIFQTNCEENVDKNNCTGLKYVAKSGTIRIRNCGNGVALNTSVYCNRVLYFTDDDKVVTLRTLQVGECIDIGALIYIDGTKQEYYLKLACNDIYKGNYLFIIKFGYEDGKFYCQQIE